MHRILIAIAASGLLVQAAVSTAPNMSTQNWKLVWGHVGGLCARLQPCVMGAHNHRPKRLT